MKIANAPCSWGVLEFELDAEPIGFDQVLDEITETGYVGTELGDWGFMPTNSEKLRSELEKRDLELLAAFVPIAFANREKIYNGLEIAIQTAKLLNETAGDQTFIVLADDNGTIADRTKNAGRITPELELTADQWKNYASAVDRVAKAIRDETGLRSVFHHHCAGYVETPNEIRRLLEMTDPDLVGLCYDTGHARFGGAEPIDLLNQFADRIWHVHFKDCDPAIAARSRENGWDYFEAVRNGVFCELGNGEIYFPKVISILRENGYDGWIVVEQDVLPGMGSPKESADRNRKYLRNIGL